MGIDDDELSTPGNTLAAAIREAEARGWVGKDARDEARAVLSGADPTTPPADYAPTDGPADLLRSGTPESVARSLTGVVTPGDGVLTPITETALYDVDTWCVVHECDLATCGLAGRPCVGEYVVGDRVQPVPATPVPVQVIHPDGGSSALRPVSSEATVHRDRSATDGRVTTRLSIDTLRTDPAAGEMFLNLSVTYMGDPVGIERIVREAERRAQTLGWSPVEAMQSVWDDVRARRFRPVDHPDGGH